MGRGEGGHKKGSYPLPTNRGLGPSQGQQALRVGQDWPLKAQRVGVWLVLVLGTAIGPELLRALPQSCPPSVERQRG